LSAYAERQNGTIIKLWRIAETASKTDELKTFKELIAYAKKHAIELDGILFYKVDRAAVQSSRGDCHALEQIISLYVDCVLQNDAPIEQITAFMHSAS
jgi:hypothetical protein